MFVVIFRAVTNDLDEEYAKTAQKMRQRALGKYGCLDFVAVCEGKQEIALSYWTCEADILKWKADAQHLVAQKHGQQKWYESYSVEIAEISRQYNFLGA